MEANRTTDPSEPTRSHRLRRLAAGALAGAVATTSTLTLVGQAPAGAEFSDAAVPRVVSRGTNGSPVAGYVSETAISGNGRFVAFVTTAALVPEDTNGKADVYVRDRWASVTELVSLTSAGKPLDDASTLPSLSDDGRYVAFLTKASNLIPGDDKGFSDAFVRDRYTAKTIRVAPGLGGALLDHHVTQVHMAGGGGHVAFVTQASNVVPSDTNSNPDAFVRDLTTGAIGRVSVAAGGGQSSGSAVNASISDDGRHVAFEHSALLAGGVSGKQNVYVRDRTAGTTVLVNLSSAGVVPNAGAFSPSISGNGRVVVFASDASNLVPGDTNTGYDVFARDIVAGSTHRVSLPDGGGEFTYGASSVPYGVNDDGSRVLFSSYGKGTAGADAGNDSDIFVRDRKTNRTIRVTSSPTLPDPGTHSFFASIDDVGGSVAFRMTPKLTFDAPFDQAYVHGAAPIGAHSNLAKSIDQIHMDFLGRLATPAERTQWSERVQLGSGDLATLVAQLAADPAYANSRAPMVRMYWAFFLRRPDASGLEYWLKRYQGGTKLTTIAQSFATSSEFKNRYGNVGNQQYVKLVYQNIFNRQPDASGLAFWTGKLDRKEITRGGVIVQFSESSEGKRRLAGPTNITLIALAMLRKTPDAALWNQLYPTVAAGEKQAAWIGRQVLASNAYSARFGK